MKQKNNIEQRKKEIAKKINNVENPSIYSLIIAIIWIIIIFALSGIFMSMNKRNYLYNINLVSFIGDFIAIIWLGLRLGFLEKLSMNFKNIRNKQLGKLYKIKIDKYDINSYRKYKEKKSYVGILVLASTMILITIITIIIQQI